MLWFSHFFNKEIEYELCVPSSTPVSFGFDSLLNQILKHNIIILVLDCVKEMYGLFLLYIIIIICTL